MKQFIFAFIRTQKTILIFCGLACHVVFAAEQNCTAQAKTFEYDKEATEQLQNLIKDKKSKTAQVAELLFNSNANIHVLDSENNENLLHNVSCDL